VNVHIPLGKKTLVMGIINVTPDSFYSGSRIQGIEEAVERALQFEELGADIVDIGGESTRPESTAVPAEAEIARIIPVIEGIRKRSNITISVDTYKSEVASRALECDVQIINDITGLGSAYTHAASEKEITDESTFPHGQQGLGWQHFGRIVAQSGAYIVLMHMRGTPSDMQSRTTYSDVTKEVSAELDLAIQRAVDSGVARDRIILDPGIGFAKTAEQNLFLLKNLPLIREKGFPILVGLSRKSFLGVYTGREPEDRLASTIAANAISIFQGADIIRVHDIREAVDTIRIVDALEKV
jgi:dihydropteroate synthase